MGCASSKTDPVIDTSIVKGDEHPAKSEVKDLPVKQKSDVEEAAKSPSKSKSGSGEKKDEEDQISEGSSSDEEGSDSGSGTVDAEARRAELAAALENEGIEQIKPAVSRVMSTKAKLEKQASKTGVPAKQASKKGSQQWENDVLANYERKPTGEGEPTTA